MTEQITATVHAIAEDGLPDMDNKDLTGRVAFIFDGCIVSGWPLVPRQEFADIYQRAGVYEDDPDLWEGNSDVAHNRPFYGVTHWVEFPEPLWSIK